MLNHARTLLLNVNRPTSLTLGVGDEPILATYRPVRLPTQLGSFRKFLLGTAEDPLYQNYVLYQCMTVLHMQPQAEAYINSLDTRVTYQNSPSAARARFRFRYVTTSILPKTMALGTLGEAVADEREGRAYFGWHLETVDGPAIRVSSDSGRKVSHAVEVVDGRTTPVALQPGFSVVLTVPTVFEVGAQWRIEAYTRPDRGLDAVMAELTDSRRDLAANVMDGVDASFRAMWNDGGAMYVRMAALLTGYIGKVEALRNG